MDRIGVGLLGLGTVGSGVATLLAERAERIACRAGRRLELRAVLVRDRSRPRAISLAESTALTDDPRRVIDDPSIAIVVEAVGGTDGARRLALDALAAGKDVVTANKALLAEHGGEIFAAARRNGRAVAFEASVGGGIPIIQALAVGLAANQVTALSAILNGTCNFILTSMTREGMSYRDALAGAQEAGYAEPDPTLDVDGTDTAHKLAILARLAFGTEVQLDQIPTQGIDGLQVADITYASELGYHIKLLAQARLTVAGLALRVAPRLVRIGTPLADVAGPYNAIRVVGDVVGDTLFYGRGAGAMPTASAIVGDLIDVAVGRAGLTARALESWHASVAPPRLAPPASSSRRHYLRFQIADRPGVLGAIAQVLGRHEVSIASVIQRDPGDDQPGAPVSLVIMTHAAIESKLLAALAQIDPLDSIVAPSICLGVED